MEIVAMPMPIYFQTKHTRRGPSFTLTNPQILHTLDLFSASFPQKLMISFQLNGLCCLPATTKQGPGFPLWKNTVQCFSHSEEHESKSSCCKPKAGRGLESSALCSQSVIQSGWSFTAGRWVKWTARVSPLISFWVPRLLLFLHARNMSLSWFAMQKPMFLKLKTPLEKNNYDCILKTQLSNLPANLLHFVEVCQAAMTKKFPADSSCDLEHRLLSGNLSQGKETSNEGRKALQLQQLAQLTSFVFSLSGNH